mgnify:CR=1 FL=1
MAITKVTEGVRTLGTGEVLTANMDTDPTNASNLSSGSVPTAQLGNVDTSGITANKDDIALLAFKTQANGNLARYNLVDQSVDSFEDTSGVDAGNSTNEYRSIGGKYYTGAAVGADTFNASTSTGADTWTCPTDVTRAEILVVAGGGGSSGLGGGGGAGGVVHHTNYTVVPAVTYDITVGAGSAGTLYNTNPVNGGDSVFNSRAEGSQSPMTAIGGGFGSSGISPSNAGGDGGSGGGGNGGYATPGGAATQGDSGGGTGYGFPAGDGASSGGSKGGGGGGAGGIGEFMPPATGSVAGVGGAGRLFSTFVAYGTNSSNAASGGSDGGYFGGGGGGGGAASETGGAGGVGGGADGVGGTTPPTGSPAGYGHDALVNTGGGGGGSYGEAGMVGGDGGDGVVLLKYNTVVEGSDLTLVSNAVTAESAPTNGDLVITTSNGAGTTTVNTDIKAYITRDGSDYTSAVTLVSQGTSGGQTILTANGVDLSGETSGTSMRYKITTHNQSASKTTRIHAVSLGWS